MPDAMGMVTKQETFDAILRVGISEKAALQTTDVNFGPDPSRSLNVFLMNTIKEPPMVPDPAGPIEHFRSTGIRDAEKPNNFKYKQFERCAEFDGELGWFSLIDIRDCATLVWDHENATLDADSLPAVIPSNDVNEARRPPNCTVNDSGPELCNSQLHGAILFLFQELGTPTGENARLSKEDMRKIYMEATYPPDFMARSPRDCVDADDPSAAGCQQCLSEVGDAIAGSALAQRYCRCLNSKLLSQEELDAIPEHGELGCPDATVSMASGTGNATTRSANDGDACEPFCSAAGSFMSGMAGLDSDRHRRRS